MHLEKKHVEKHAWKNALGTKKSSIEDWKVSQAKKEKKTRVPFLNVTL